MRINKKYVNLFQEIKKIKIIQIIIQIKKIMLDWNLDYSVAMLNNRIQQVKIH